MSDCCHKRKTKQRTEAEIRALCNRLNRIEGQIRGIRTMVEEDGYCTDILTQTAAASAALNAFRTELLSEHIRSCVADGLRAGDDAVVDELLDILKKLMK